MWTFHDNNSQKNARENQQSYALDLDPLPHPPRPQEVLEGFRISNLPNIKNTTFGHQTRTKMNVPSRILAMARKLGSSSRSFNVAKRPSSAVSHG